jgi:hypothetical protein
MRDPNQEKPGIYIQKTFKNSKLVSLANNTVRRSLEEIRKQANYDKQAIIKHSIAY